MSETEKEKKHIHQSVREKTGTYLIAALGVVAGLAWNDAIRAFIDYVFPVSTNSILAKFLYAVLITAVVVLLSGWIMRYLSPEKKDNA